MAIKSLIFDFDGLMLDTESPEYIILQEIYRNFGLELPLEEWAKALGASPEAFDPFAYLAEKANQPIDTLSLKNSFKERALEKIHQQPPMPGVLALLERAEQLGLKLAVASSSPRAWVHDHLKRMGLHQRFQSILTRDDVTYPKPHPELYQTTLKVFGLQPHEAIVFEDSPNGITAARAAGIFTVGVPNHVTRLLDTSHASLILNSLADLTLDELILRTNHNA